VTESDDPLDANYQLADLPIEVKAHIDNKLKEAEDLIIKYIGRLPSTKFDTNTLDEVIGKWRKSTDPNKEKPEYVIEALGSAFGQDIVNTLNCEWKVLTDQQGSDLTVIHKKYKVNGFPFSSAEKAVTENKADYFQTIKLAIKHHIAEAQKNGEVQERQ
jgi:Domain of unknown function (DUF3806)